MAESKRGLKCVLYCRCMYTVPENSGMSVDSSHCWDGVVDMFSAVNYSHGKFGKANHFSRGPIHENGLFRPLFCKKVVLARNIGLHEMRTIVAIVW